MLPLPSHLRCTTLHPLVALCRSQVVQARLEVAYQYRERRDSEASKIRATAAEADAASVRSECARALRVAEEAEARAAAVDEVRPKAEPGTFRCCSAVAAAAAAAGVCSASDGPLSTLPSVR